MKSDVSNDFIVFRPSDNSLSQSSKSSDENQNIKEIDIENMSFHSKKKHSSRMKL